MIQNLIKRGNELIIIEFSEGNCEAKSSGKSSNVCLGNSESFLLLFLEVTNSTVDLFQVKACDWIFT